MKYKAIRDFVDLQDGRHQYRAGDEFPRPGVTVTVGRLRELAGSKNKSKKPLIAEVEDVPDGIVPEPKKLVRQRKKKVDRES